ncbi:phenylacetate--CoA ligase [Verticiella sediminum]|uniref:Phenylacetate--CoA ligase n=1 Tax=Verticiella sediminum TaxID=1247510 RepID=A0A556AY56_9BURK|nr:phenylacetate--CoA ligase [Verticiella sediminum]TSH97861.1 phenylacetate--CoA ligase [Verticiella sediminum]
MNSPIPYYLTSVDWPRLIQDYPPPPHYAETSGALSDEAMRQLQEQRLRARIADAARLPFYAERWRAAGVDAADVRGLEDLPHLPTFDSDELRSSQEARPPYGAHQPSPAEWDDVLPLKLQTSGGTTGAPRLTLFDPVALEVQGIQTARGLYAQGARPGDLIQIPFTASLANAGWSAYNAVHHWLGGVPVTTGSGNVTSSEKQLEYARTLGTAGWYANADYLGRLTAVAQDIGFDLHALRTKFLFSFLGADDGTVRRALSDAWNAPVYDNYGSHEVGLIAWECQAGTRHINEDTVIVEILDEDGRPVPDGTYGHAVLTSLHRKIPVYLRYDIRDRLAVLPRARCACGVLSKRLLPMQGRVDQMIKLRGTNIYPSSCHRTVSADPRTNGEYLCVVSHSGAGLARRLEMCVRIERRSTQVDADALRTDMLRRLASDLGAKVDVEIVDPGALRPHTGEGEKIRRVLDLRKAG